MALLSNSKWFCLLHYPKYLTARSMYTSEAKNPVRIGCSSGFWGDTQTSSAQLVHKGSINYLVSDYLSEITMSLLTAAKQKDNTKGYAPDFVSFAIAPLIDEMKKKNIRVISNAGGINPQACAEALQFAAQKRGKNFDIAVITGDNVLPYHPTLFKSGKVRDIESRLPLPESVMSMNAYFGAESIRKALDLGAEVVITGRCVDSALVLGPLMHEFNWDVSDYDKLASGSLAGHLVECGAQATGGIFTDWQTVPDWDNIGFPIAECYEDGSFLITKPPGTGGLVTPATVAEQLVYEIGDPTAYKLPDVTCDFRNVSITQKENDSVLVQGAKGYAPSRVLKICATYLDGFRTTAVFSVGGKQAIAKGHRTAESIVKRARKLFSTLGMDDFSRVHIQAFGEEYLYGKNARKYNNNEPRETVMWLAVEHKDKKALQLFSMEIAAAGTGMAPGLCGLVGGRPKVSPVLKLFSFYHAKSNVPVVIHHQGKDIETLHFRDDDPGSPVPIAQSKTEVQPGANTYTLDQLAYARSGDKGNSANIGVIARHPSYIPYLRKYLTADVVHKYFEHLFASDIRGKPVERYELPGISGFNFVMNNCLGGGGVASLRTDPQGKSFAQMLLDLELKNLPKFENVGK